MKTCSTCKEEKPLTEYYANGYQPSGAKKYKAKCKKCQEAHNSGDKYSKIDQILLDTGRELACEMCGYKKNRAALCFHHLDEEEKDFGFAKVNTISKERLRIEMEKCVLLCHNCHMEEHYPHLEIVDDNN